ncbi:MAG: tRNA (N(6)-L-threonylcarbamoyladenosine(37)-C(2))-methylthiotransferase [Methermicoccaceae archaeon]
MQVKLETFGCTSNRADSQRIHEFLSTIGHRVVGDGEDINESDGNNIVVVNTCVVTAGTERKVLKKLKALEESKTPYAVAGCLPAARPQLLEELTPQGVLTPKMLAGCEALAASGEYNEAARKLATYLGIPIEENINDTTYPHAPPNGQNTPYMLNISIGCNGSCSYCIVKRARGSLKSVPIPQLVDKIRMAVENGRKEVHLTGQDVGAYGMDVSPNITENNLATLLNAISSIDKSFFVRVGMITPSSVISIMNPLVQAFSSSKVFNFVHLPVQSGSNKVLELMHREYNTNDFERLVECFRKKLNAAICTDVIVGFPGETEEDFEHTLSLIKRVVPEKLNITRFSPRPGTKAFKMDEIAGEVKKERSRITTSLYLNQASKRMKRMVGKQLVVLTTEKIKKGTTLARDSRYTNVVVKGDYPIWKVIEVEVIDYHPMYLIAEPLDDVDEYIMPLEMFEKEI